MIITPRLQKAVDTATTLHKNHTRIGQANTPYVSHLLNVMRILETCTEDEDTLIAGLLHDTIEDIPEYTGEMIEESFGINVRSIVESLTEIRTFSDSLSIRERWIQAKKSYLLKLTHASGAARMISAADKIDNMDSIALGYNSRDMVLMERFDSLALTGQIWFAGEVLKILSGNIPKALEDKYLKSLNNLKSIQQTS